MAQQGRDIFDKLRNFDAYPKTLEDFRIKTFGGAAVTLVSSGIMVLLFLSELHDYLVPEIQEELFVDTTRGQKLRINVDIVFPRISCPYLSMDAMDVSGDHHINIEHNMFKRRLDKEGKPIEDPKKEENFGVKATEMPSEKEVAESNTTTEAPKCGSCYGAEINKNQCCNTCDEVREAYRRKGWVLQKTEDVEQCKNEKSVELKKAAFSEGCQVFGYVEVNRVGGNFHVAPGKSYSVNHIHVHDVQPFLSSDFNLTHRIRHFSFGKAVIGKSDPLDGTEVVADAGAMMYQYYLKIVPTTYVKADGSVFYSNQFSVTRHQKSTSVFSGDSGLPGVFFIYELSPMMVKYSEQEKSFGHFLTGVCAIIGGVFTVAGLIDSAIYHSAKALQRKIELGKAT